MTGGMWGIFLENTRTGQRELFENTISDDEETVRAVHANLSRSGHPFYRFILYEFPCPAPVITEDLPHIIVTSGPIT